MSNTQSFLAILSIGIAAPALGWDFKPQAGLNYTTNANLDESGLADVFWWSRASVGGGLGSAAWKGSLSYFDYLKQNSNDRFAWSTDVEWFSDKRLQMKIDFAGQHYVGESPETTDEGFDFVRTGFSLSRTTPLSNDQELFLAGGYQLKSFVGLSGRMDHKLFIMADRNWRMGKSEFVPDAESGLVWSNESLYSKAYGRLGLEWNYSLAPDLRLQTQVALQVSAFPARSITDATATSRGRGTKGSSRGAGVMEMQSLSESGLALVQSWSRLSLKAGLEFQSQKTRSGFEDFTELQFQATLSASF
jgi:hypothetical protein